MDALSRVLDLLHFDAVFYFATNFSAPWSIQVPSYKRVARFHYVTQGHCWVKADDMNEAKLLSVGDLIIIPHGVSHILSDQPNSESMPLDEAFAQANYQGEGIFQFGSETSQHDTQLVCGHFEFDENYRHPLVDYLPPYIIRNENDGANFSWMKDSLRFMAHVARSDQVGSTAIIKRLSEVIFIQSIRFWHQEQGKQAGFLAALNDPNISRGIEAFHNNYAAEWTVEKLAERACMSRSLFAEKFKQYLNLSPMQYVVNWRMQYACKMLSENKLSLDQVASTIGYESLASFSKAFKRTIGQNPGEYRKSRLLA